MSEADSLETPLLATSKFLDPNVTADGQKRASVRLTGLRTLWFNTGTLCNLTCSNCYIESSPTNDRLVYLSAAEVTHYLDELSKMDAPVQEIAFTGGEPFMNPEFCKMLQICAERGFDILVLTNAMRPMMKCADQLLALQVRYGERLTIRVSLDHYSASLHDLYRGERAFERAWAGVRWLAGNGFRLNIAGRTFWNESEARLREGYARLFESEELPFDAANPTTLMLFPEMDETLDVPEITEECWSILGQKPDDMMCASSRMIVKRKGDSHPVVLPCTLLPYDSRFELGRSLLSAPSEVPLNHPHCTRFCVLGGGACSRSD